MATSRIKTSSVLQGFPKSRSLLAGYPPVMAAPTATDGGTGTTASVAFTAVSGATSYTVLSTPGSFTGTGSSSPITVSGLTAGTAYTFQVRATNSVGTGPYSAASNSVTPIVPTAFESIASISGTGSSSSFTFSSIPQTYKHLQIRAILRENSGGNSNGSLKLQFNGSGSSVGRGHWFQALGDTSPYTNAQYDSGDMYIQYVSVGSAATGNVYGMLIMDIMDYSNTSKNKVIRNFYGINANNLAATSAAVGSNSNLWVNTSAINEIKLIGQNNNPYTTLSNVALYGIKGA